VKHEYLLLCLVNALGLKDYNDSIYFYPMTYIIFACGSVTPSHRPIVWSIDCECKIKNWYIALQVSFENLWNGSFSATISEFLAGFNWKFVTGFFAGSSSSSWCDLAGLGDNHLATLYLQPSSFRTCQPSCLSLLVQWVYFCSIFQQNSLPSNIQLFSLQFFRI